jgi:hypothetical protein
MEKSKFTNSQIMTALKHTESGIPVPEIFRKLGSISLDHFQWAADHTDTSTLAGAPPGLRQRAKKAQGSWQNQANISLRAQR